MVDVLTLLRDANPVAEGPAPPMDAVWLKLERTALPTPRRARRRWLALTPLVAAAVAFAVLLTGAPGLSIAARVYAATAGNGVVVHYTAVTSLTQRGLPGGRARGKLSPRELELRGCRARSDVPPAAGQPVESTIRGDGVRTTQPVGVERAAERDHARGLPRRHARSGALPVGAVY